jgi:hypothetical protein
MSEDSRVVKRLIAAFNAHRVEPLRELYAETTAADALRSKALSPGSARYGQMSAGCLRLCEVRSAETETRFGTLPSPATARFDAQLTAISAVSANGGTSSILSPLQNRPGSYQLAGRRAGSSPMCWYVVATSSAQ